MTSSNSANDEITFLHTGNEEDEFFKSESCGSNCFECCRTVFKFKACQKFAVPKLMLVILCLVQMLMFVAHTGLLSSSVSTIEKRYQLRSTETGYIVSVFDFMAIPSFIVVALIGDNIARKPFWMSLGAIVCGIGCIVFVIPHFVSPAYKYNFYTGNGTSTNTCRNETFQISSRCINNNLRNYRFLLMAGVAFLSIGGNPFYIYAVSYIDENVKKETSSFYIGVFNAFSGVGAAIGFVLGGLILKVYLYPFKTVDIDIRSQVWIGAWWLGFIVTGIVLIICAIPVMLLPAHLPNTRHLRINRSNEVQKDTLKNATNKNNQEKNEINKSRKIFFNFLSLIKNLPFLFVTFGSAVNFSLILGFNTFGPKYIESMFNRTPSESALYFGLCAVFAAAGGQLLGGLIVKKLKLTIRGIGKFIILCALISCLCSLGFLIKCPNVKFSGGTVPYGSNTSNINRFTLKANNFSLLANCNSHCKCSTEKYDPVCGDDGVSYFSPCFAGCASQTSSIYTDCSCITAAHNNISSTAIVSNSCNNNKCPYQMPIFLCIVFFCFITSIITDTPANLITIRCVPFNQRITAFSFQKVIVHGLGIIPGRVLAGAVMDLSCAVWSTECGESGSCKTYRRDELSKNMTILLFSETAVVLICYCLSYYFYIPNDETEILNENEPNKRETSEV